ncbi:lasso peptide biosynthesis B2 protein [Caulobacter soli]|uniref:lasso peptide biosynthesis B2 protein n=1 Tax=Caulobacter soli TaxID=2708539 RepID=UPI0013EC4CBB|nr:lasso peptide biosynthesis B2 protein [Caulobacter soli]
MTYGLRPGVSFCEAEGRVIVLDVVADRYFQLGPGPATCLRALVAGETSAGDVSALVACGLLVKDAEGARRGVAPFCWPQARGSVGEAARAGGRARMVDLIGVSVALARAWMLLETWPFARVLARLSARKPRLSILGPGPEAEAWAARFTACRSLLPLKAVCLRDSLALLEFLADKGLVADLVIGVEVAPFSAHCWVQAADQALNDTVLRVRRHTPILAV